MRLIGIGFGVGIIGKGLSIVNPIRWILNSDLFSYIGVSYIWDDAETWVDSNVWKG